MKPREIKPYIYWVGAIDWGRRLFDSLIPLPDGTSYNSYLIKGSDKTALLDTVDPPMQDVLMNNLSQLEINSIDYIVAHHAEQDHSGAIPQVLNRYPKAKVITTPKCKDMLMDLLNIEPGQFITVADKETISLGNKTLEFIYTPWVHWPETMTTYLKEDNMLFPCDFFGAHLATTDLYVTDEGQVDESAKRYFAAIMMPFKNIIRKNLTKLKDYKIDIIAPSHGPIYDRPEFILRACNSWVFDKPKNIVVLPYVSMHGSTYKMVDYLVGALVQKGVTVKQFDLTVTDIGKLAVALVDAATVVMGTPTILAGPHPTVAYAAIMANALRPTIKFVSIIGSYGWGGKAIETLAALIPNLKVEILDPVLCKGQPRQADLEALDTLASAITQKHQEAGFK
jgi:flavorubredoxin